MQYINMFVLSRHLNLCLKGTPICSIMVCSCWVNLCFLLYRYYEMHYVGLFVLLRHLYLPIQVSKWLGKQ